MASKTLEDHLFELYTGKPFFGNIPVVDASFFNDSPKPQDGICDYIKKTSKAFSGTIEPLFPELCTPSGRLNNIFNNTTHKPYTSHNICADTPKKDSKFELEVYGSGFKILLEENKPLMRFDVKHHEHGDKHIQWGYDEFTGRLGNEAADIFGSVMKIIGGSLKFPWEE